MPSVPLTSSRQPRTHAARLGAHRLRRRVGAFGIVMGLVAVSAALAPAVQAASTGAQRSSALPGQGAGVAAVTADDGSSVTQTHDWLDDEGDSRSGSVTVSKTQNLATREIVDISWNGFLPTVNSEGASSVHQAPQAAIASGYPVMLMECQGDDAATMTPADCALPNPNRFYYYAVDDAQETQEVQNSSPVDSRSFTETSGKVDEAATGEYVPLPSDFSDANVLGTNWYATWTDPDGTHANARFEVRSTKEAPQSLGCGDPDNRSKGACSIVVVPVRPMDCKTKSACPGPTGDLGLSTDYKEWQSASNWRNKFVIPVTFRPFPDVCDLDSRIAVPTQGSQILNQAMSSWLPKFCTSDDLFKLSFTRVNDSTARTNLTTKLAGDYGSNLAFTTEPAHSAAGRPVVNAPVAVSGFGVALALDATNYEQVDDVNLDARLLAKLVTESYNAPPDPNVEGNPESLLTDPEFAKLNPDLVARLPAATQIDNPILVQGSPDLVHEVTRYIASDADAVAWLGGKADPWGMKVNPYYQGDKWPVPNAQFEIRDPYEWKDDPRQCEPKPVMEQIGQFVYDLASVADAMVNRQPQDYSVCKVVGQGGDVYAWGHSDRQLLGQRAMLAIMDLPSADAYQFPMAALQNHAGEFVVPSTDSLKSALSVATVDKMTGTLSANLQSSSPTAYPGLMPVYAAAPTHGLTKTQASQYASMIRWLSTSGQTYGDEAGQLPAGYLALPATLQAQSATAAVHVLKQDCFGLVKGDRSCSTTPPTTTPTTPTTPPTPTTPGDGSGGGGGSGGGSGGSGGSGYGGGSGGSTLPGSGGSGGLPSGGASPTFPTGAPTSPSSPTTQPLAYTSSQKSSLAAHLVPVLLVIGLLGLVLAPLLVLASRPGGMDGLTALRSRLAGGRSAGPRKPSGSS